MKKITMPRSPKRKALRRYQLAAATAYKRAKERDEGNGHAPGPVRVIDTNSEEGAAIARRLLNEAC